MEMTFMTMFFRPFALIAGVILLILSFMIFREVKKSAKGYFYLAFFGLSLFLWSFSAIVFKRLDWFFTRQITGIVFLLLIGVFACYALTRLVEDFWLEKPKWLTSNSIVIGYMGLFAVLLLSNFLFMGGDFSSSEMVLQKIISVAHLTLAIGFLIASIPAFYLYKGSKEWRWLALLIAFILIGFALLIGSYYDGCCGKKGRSADDKICAQYDLDYMRVYDVTCVEGLISFGKFYQLILVVGSTLVDVSFFLVWRNLWSNRKDNEKKS